MVTLNEEPEYDVAVCVKTFNRPQYTQQVIESFENCVYKEWVDWKFFQDGAVNKYSNIRRADDETIEESISILEQAELPNKSLHINEHNIGHAEQTEKIYAYYDDYDLIIIVEGDIVVSKYFIIQMLSLIEQFPDMVASLYGPGVGDNDEDHLDEVNISGVCNWFTSAMWEDTYREIEDRFADFMDIVGGQDFWVGNRPSNKILNEFQEDTDIAPALDGVLGQLLRDNNIPRVKPRVCRCSNIGKVGMNSNERAYNESGYGEEYPIEYESDKEPRDWTVNKYGWPFENWGD